MAECCDGMMEALKGTLLGEMKQLVDENIDDYLKAKDGAKLASTRSRKRMLRVKELALLIRKEMLESRGK